MSVRRTTEGAQAAHANPLLLQRQDPRTALSIQRARSAPSRSACREWAALHCGGCHSDSSASSASSSADCKAATVRIRNPHKSHRTKYYGFLLIFLSAIILQRSSAFPVTPSGQKIVLHTTQHRLRHHQQLLQQLQRQRAQESQAQTSPLRPQHHLQHRSVPEMAEISAGNDEADYSRANNAFCLNADHLKNMLVQANKTYAYISSLLSDYTNSQYKKTPEEVHVTWMKHMFQLEHPLTKALERDFYRLPERQHFARFINEPLTREMIIKEMQNVYTALRILKAALDHVIQNRKENKIQLLHDLHNNLSSFNKINEFFAEVRKMVKVDLHEVSKFMEKLDIPLPQVEEQSAYHSRTEVRDWLLASEHLSVTQYLRMLYSTLLEKCPEMAAE